MNRAGKPRNDIWVSPVVDSTDDTAAHAPTAGPRRVAGTLAWAFFGAWYALWMSNAAGYSWPASSAGSLTTTRFWYLGAFVLGAFFMALLRSNSPLFDKRLTCTLGALMILAGSIGVLFAQNAHAIYLLSSIAAGLGSAMLAAGVGEILGSLNSEQRSQLLIAGPTLAAAVFLIATSLQPIGLVFFALFLPPLSCALFLVDAKNNPRLVSAIRETPRREMTPRYLFGTALFGLVAGIMYGLVYLPIDPSMQFWNPFALAAGFFLLLITVVMLSRLSHSAPLGIRIAVAPLVMSGVLVLPYIGTSTSRIVQVAVAVGVLSYSIWFISEQTIIGSAAAAFSAAAGFGQLVGCLFGYMLVNQIMSTLDQRTLAALLSVYALVLSATWYLLRQVGPSSTRNKGSSEETASLINERIAVRYGLTPREKEVFALLAQGRSREYVRKTLMISDGTAKTHTNHIHQKLGIHSREELLDLVLDYSRRASDSAS